MFVRPCILLRFPMLAALLLAATTLSRPALGQAVVLGTQTVSFSNQSEELNGTPTLTLNKFNGAGTLTEVQITASGSASTSGSVTNTAAQAQSFTVRSFAFQLDLNAGAGSPAALTNYTDPNSGSPGALSIFYGQTVGSKSFTSLAAGASSSFGPFTISDVSALVDFTSASDVAGFIGAGTFVLNPFTSTATSVAGGGGNVATNLSTLYSASVTVTYLGTPAPAVPEPSSFALAGMIALLAGGRAFMARARRRAA